MLQICTTKHRVATGSSPLDPAQRPQRPPLQGNLGGGASPTTRHTSDNKLGDQLVNTPNPPPPLPTTYADDILPTARQVMHAQEELEDQNDAFDLINTKYYNNESGNYLSLSFTQLNRLIHVIHPPTKYATNVI